MDDEKHIVRVLEFVCDNDADAAVWVKQLVDGHDVEVWSGERFVALVGPSAK
jgi:hypothetical protein